MYVKNKKTKPHQPGWWPETKRIEVITTYLSTRSVGLTESLTGVPRNTINTWMRQPWWKEHVEDIQNSEHVELDKKLVKVMDKALDAVMDRLENGEYQYDEKTGRIVRIPAKLRDTNKVLTDMIDKRALIEKTKKQEQKPQEITVDHLMKLAETFADFANGKGRPKEKQISVIDGEVIIEELTNGVQEKGENAPKA